jgi:Ca2+-binding RTX toxin-like protein
LHGGEGDDLLDGGDGDDFLSGDNGNDTLLGGNGNDTLFGGMGDDVLDGGAGVDLVSYGFATTVGVTVNLATGIATGQGNDHISNVENVSGTAGGDDLLIGNSVANLLLGDAGNDTLVGAGGDDNLEGGTGNDVIEGDAGNDFIVGGDGLDIALYGSPRSNYLIRGNAGADQFTVTDHVGGDGTDTLIGIERLVFADTKTALDLLGNAGEVAKILGAVFGSAGVHNKSFVGIGLSLADSGMSYDQLLQAAIDARLGHGAANGALVDLLWANLVGSPPDAGARAQFVSLLDTGLFSQIGLARLAAEHPANLANIDFAGLTLSGLDYV